MMNLILKAKKVKEMAILEKAIERSEGQIMILEQDMIWWNNYLSLPSNPKTSQILYCIFPSTSSGDEYMCHCFLDAPFSFSFKKLLPEAWRSLRGNNLQNTSGIKTALSCHPAGCKCSAKTLEDAIAMAKLAVEA